MIEFVGSFTLGGVMPGAVAFGAFGAAELGTKLEALIEAQAAIALQPPQVSFQANIDLALDTIASLQAAIEFGITPPSIALQLQIVADAIAEVQASLALVADLLLAFDAAGVWCYKYSGPADQFGSELSSELSSGLPGGSGASEHIDAIVLATNLGPTVSAMQTIFI